MNEIKLDEKSHIPERKAFKDNFTNTLYKRPFLIEKIKKDLNRRKNYNSIEPTNSDKHLLELKQKLKEKVIKDNPLKAKLAISKNIDKIYKFIRKINTNNLNIKSIKSRDGIIPAKKKFNRQRSDFDLPMISSRKIRKQLIIRDNNKNISYLNDNSKDQENIVCSEIMDPKEMFKNNQRIIKIRSFVNTSRGSDISMNNEAKLYDINEINEKYNLKLNLSNISKHQSKIFQGRKYTIIGMLNKLFEYYSSENSHNIFPSNIDYQTSNYINYSKSNNSILLNNDTHDMKYDDKNNIKNRHKDISNKFSNKLLIESKLKYDQSSTSDINIVNMSESPQVEDTNTFLTKLVVNNRSINNRINNESKEEISNPKKEYSVTKLINSRCSLDDITRRNKEIMENNKRINIDCLMSKIEQNISIKKILYKYLGKSVHQLENDPSYLRLKELEKKIIAILKEK